MAQGESDRRPSLGEFLFSELHQAFQDIRQKVVEEGWFGRVVSPAPVVEMDRTDRPVQQRGSPSDRRPGFDELWAPRESEPADQRRDHGMDIDR